MEQQDKTNRKTMTIHFHDDEHNLESLKNSDQFLKVQIQNEILEKIKDNKDLNKVAEVFADNVASQIIPFCEKPEYGTLIISIDQHGTYTKSKTKAYIENTGIQHELSYNRKHYSTKIFINSLLKKINEKSQNSNVIFHLCTCNAAAAMFNQKHNMSDSTNLIGPMQLIMHSGTNYVHPKIVSKSMIEYMAKNKNANILEMLKYAALNRIKMTIAIVDDHGKIERVKLKYPLSSFKNLEERKKIFYDVINKLETNENFCRINNYSKTDFLTIKNDFENEFNQQINNKIAALLNDINFLIRESMNYIYSKNNTQKLKEYRELYSSEAIHNIFLQILEEIEKDPKKYENELKDCFLALILKLIKTHDPYFIDALSINKKNELTNFAAKFIELATKPEYADHFKNHIKDIDVTIDTQVLLIGISEKLYKHYEEYCKKKNKNEILDSFQDRFRKEFILLITDPKMHQEIYQNLNKINTYVLISLLSSTSVKKKRNFLVKLNDINTNQWNFIAQYILTSKELVKISAIFYDFHQICQDLQQWHAYVTYAEEMIKNSPNTDDFEKRAFFSSTLLKNWGNFDYKKFENDNEKSPLLKKLLDPSIEKINDIVFTEIKNTIIKRTYNSAILLPYFLSGIFKSSLFIENDNQDRLTKKQNIKICFALIKRIPLLNDYRKISNFIIEIEKNRDKIINENGKLNNEKIMSIFDEVQKKRLNSSTQDMKLLEPSIQKKQQK